MKSNNLWGSQVSAPSAAPPEISSLSHQGRPSGERIRAPPRPSHSSGEGLTPSVLPSLAFACESPLEAVQEAVAGVAGVRGGEGASGPGAMRSGSNARLERGQLAPLVPQVLNHAQQSQAEKQLLRVTTSHLGPEAAIAGAAAAAPSKVIAAPRGSGEKAEAKASCRTFLDRLRKVMLKRDYALFVEAMKLFTSKKVRERRLRLEPAC